jgi:hypothetical protein
LRADGSIYQEETMKKTIALLLVLASAAALIGCGVTSRHYGRTYNVPTRNTLGAPYGGYVHGGTDGRTDNTYRAPRTAGGGYAAQNPGYGNGLMRSGGYGESALHNNRTSAIPGGQRAIMPRTQVRDGVQTPNPLQDGVQNQNQNRTARAQTQDGMTGDGVQTRNTPRSAPNSQFHNAHGNAHAKHRAS